MRRSIERAGWIGAVLGGVAGAVFGAGLLLPEHADNSKLVIVLPLFAVGYGCLGTICGAAVFALLAIIARPFRRHESRATNTGRPQNPPLADPPPADGST